MDESTNDWVVSRADQLVTAFLPATNRQILEAILRWETDHRVHARTLDREYSGHSLRHNTGAVTRRTITDIWRVANLVALTRYVISAGHRGLPLSLMALEFRPLCDRWRDVYTFFPLRQLHFRCRGRCD